MRNQRRMGAFLALLSGAAFCGGASCEVYNPPPEATLVVPEDGRWDVASALDLRFTEPVIVASIQLTVWPARTEVEGELLPGTQPLAALCSVDSPCEGVVMTPSQTRDSIGVALGSLQGLRLGEPHILEVAAGLSDDAGHTRNVPTRFEFSLSADGGTAIDFVPMMNSGVMIVDGEIGQVNRIPFRLFMDMRMDTDGRLHILGQSAEIPPDASADSPPHEWVPSFARPGFTVAFVADVADQGGGAAFFETEPRELILQGPLPGTQLRVDAMVLSGVVRPGGGPDGRDIASGTLTSPSGALDLGGAEPIILDGTSNAWTAVGCLPAELDPRIPRVCDPAPCQQVDAQGGRCYVEAIPKDCPQQ